MTQLETAMKTIIQVFDNYAKIEGKTNTLSKGEAKTLLEKELPEFFKTMKTQEDVDKLLKELDRNKDAEINFREFMAMLTTVASPCHKGCHKK